MKTVNSHAKHIHINVNLQMIYKIKYNRHNNKVKSSSQLWQTISWTHTSHAAMCQNQLSHLLSTDSQILNKYITSPPTCESINDTHHNVQVQKTKYSRFYTNSKSVLTISLNKPPLVRQQPCSQPCSHPHTKCSKPPRHKKLQSPNLKQIAQNLAISRMNKQWMISKRQANSQRTAQRKLAK